MDLSIPTTLAALARGMCKEGRRAQGGGPIVCPIRGMQHESELNFGAISMRPIPGHPRRSTQAPRPPISIGVDRAPGTPGIIDEVLKPTKDSFEMVPGVPRRIAGKSPAPDWPSTPQLLLHRLPHRQVVKQPSSEKHGRNVNVLENQPRKGEKAREVRDFQGLCPHGVGPMVIAPFHVFTHAFTAKPSHPHIHPCTSLPIHTHPHPSTPIHQTSHLTRAAFNAGGQCKASSDSLPSSLPLGIPAAHPRSHAGPSLRPCTSASSKFPPIERMVRAGQPPILLNKLCGGLRVLRRHLRDCHASAGLVLPQKGHAAGLRASGRGGGARGARSRKDNLQMGAASGCRRYRDWNIRRGPGATGG
eukprot:151985-Chlamydomonas_euryale.AAC.3